jgi:hypothetical protein
VERVELGRARRCPPSHQQTRQMYLSGRDHRPRTCPISLMTCLRPVRTMVPSHHDGNDTNGARQHMYLVHRSSSPSRRKQVTACRVRWRSRRRSCLRAGSIRPVSTYRLRRAQRNARRSMRRGKLSSSSTSRVNHLSLGLGGHLILPKAKAKAKFKCQHRKASGALPRPRPRNSARSSSQPPSPSLPAQCAQVRLPRSCGSCWVFRARTRRQIQRNARLRQRANRPSGPR